MAEFKVLTVAKQAELLATALEVDSTPARAGMELVGDDGVAWSVVGISTPGRRRGRQGVLLKRIGDVTRMPRRDEILRTREDAEEAA